MVTYLEKAKKQLSSFSVASIKVISQSKNSNAYALAKLASMKDIDLLDVVSAEFLAESSILPQ